jgi:hypothetical protein
MSNYVLMVSLDKLTSLTSISPNLDPHTLRPNVLYAQTQVQQILGDLQYNELINKISTEQALTSEETQLMEYIGNFLVWTAAHESTLSIYMKMVNNGVTSGTDGDGRKSASIEEIKFLRSMLTNRADIYRRQLQEFIRINLGWYPLISQSNSNQVVRSQRWNNYFSGIQLDSKSYRSTPNSFNNNLTQYSELDHTDFEGCDW